MKKEIATIFRKVKYVILHLNEDPVNYVEYLIPIAIFILGIINGIITQFVFARNGGYAIQMAAIREYGLLDGYDEKFTTGTTGLIRNGFLGRIILILAGIELILIFYKCIKKVGSSLVIMQTISVFLIGFQMLMTDCLFGFDASRCYMSQEIFEKCNDIGIDIINAAATVFPATVIYIIYGIISIIILAVFIACAILVLHIDNNGQAAKNTILTLGFSMIIVPLILLFLQNVIPIVSGVLAIIIMVVLIVGCGLMLIGGITEGTEGGGETTSTYNKSKVSSERSSGSVYGKKNLNSVKMEGEKKMAERREYIKDLNCIGGIKLYKEHGFTTDYIVTFNLVMTRRICTVEEFRKGKCRIFDDKTGREITEAEIPWMK